MGISPLLTSFLFANDIKLFFKIVEALLLTVSFCNRILTPSQFGQSVLISNSTLKSVTPWLSLRKFYFLGIFAFQRVDIAKDLEFYYTPSLFLNIISMMQ